MDRRAYFTYSILGGVGWATGVTLLGFWLGGITFVRDHVELILIGIVALSIIPIVIEGIRARAQSQRTARSSR
jgi:membrane-associated protein